MGDVKRRMSSKRLDYPVRRPTHQEIAARAYPIYLERGRGDEHDLDDWLQAEYELMQLPIRGLAKLDSPADTSEKPGRRSLIELVRAAMCF